MKSYLFSFFFILVNSFLLNAQILTESNLPILVITTPNGADIIDEPKITAHLGVIYNGEGQTNNLTDNFNEYNGQIGIELRGQTSQFFPKQPYGFETRMEDGSNNNVSLLGLPAENDWVLHNPFSDKSLIRNAFVYKVAEQIMDYAPRTRLVEVVVNEYYQGVYLLTEKIKIDNNRVDIAKLQTEDIEGDELTGGYILKIDKTGEDDRGVISEYAPYDASGDQFIAFIYHSPKAEDIQPQQEIYISDFMHDFEEVLNGNDFADANIGYNNYIDVPSFIDFLLVNEISRNVDGYRISTYLYKDKDSNNPLLKMGPVWDFNIAMGNANYCEGGSTEGWAFDFNSICSEDFWLIPFWWNRLMEDPAFVNQLKARWEQLRENEWSDERLNFICDSLANTVSEASVRNYQRYPDVLGEYVWPNNFIGNTWQEEVNYMCGWMNERVEWLDENIPGVVNLLYSPDRYFEPTVQPNISDGDFVFSFYIKLNTEVKVRIFDAAGRQVDELQKRFLTNGKHEIVWNKNVAQGIYFYTIEVENKEEIFSGKIVKISVL